MSSGALPNSVTELTSAVCPTCGNRDLHRRARTGFLQNFIFPVLGYYPWECLSCRKTRMLRMRGRRVFRPLWDDGLDVMEDAVPHLDAELQVDLAADESQPHHDSVPS